VDHRQALALDRQEIAAVLADWALSRDTGRWDRLRAVYAPDATMQTTWFDGPAEHFIDQSVASFGGLVQVQHSVGASAIDVAGNRATAETRMVLLIRAPLDGAQVDVTCYARFYDFLIRLDTNWRIKKRVPVYEKDRIDAVNPETTLVLDRNRLAKYAEGYRHLAYVQSQGGATLPDGLIEPRSAAEKRLYGDGVEWLARGR
jgi:hypothetical protein